MSSKKNDMSRALISAVNEGDFKSLKKLVRSHGVSQCKEWYGGYALLRDAIKSGHTELAAFFLQEDTKADSKPNGAITLLHLAIEQRCKELVNSLLKDNAPVDAQNDQNETPLHLAVKGGYAEGVRILLSHNASVTAQNNEGSTPLLLAIEGNHEYVVEMLLEHASANLKNEMDNMSSTSSSKQQNSLLNRILLCNPCACDKVSKLVVRFVIHDESHKKTDKCGVPPREYVGRKKIVDYLSNHGFVPSREYVNESLLFAALDKGLTKLVENILTIATSPNHVNCQSGSSSHAAVDSGHTEMIILDVKDYVSFLNTAVRTYHHQTDIIVLSKLLLRSLSDINGEDEETNYTEEDTLFEILQLLLARGVDFKEAPELLHFVAKEGFVKVCELLIENRADVNALNTRGETPLFQSCEETREKESRQKKDKIVKLLLENGADANIKIKNRWSFRDESAMVTAFHYAAFSGREEAVSIFLNFGVNVDIRATDGSTPLHEACERNCQAVVEILLKHNANVDARKANGATPLHVTFATYTDYGYPQHKVVTALLENGCDFDTKFEFDYELSTFLDIVLSKAEAEQNEELRQFGSDATHLRFPYDFLSWELREGVQIVRKHAIKLEAAGLYVVREHLRQFDCKRFDLSNFPQKCQEELNRMKNEYLSPQCTLYDILINSKNPTYARNESLMGKISGFNFKKFPIYGGLIVGCLQRGESRLKLISSGQRALDVLVKTSKKLNGNKHSILPAEVLEQIVSHLTNGDLHSLIDCSEALKSQVKRQ